MRIRKNPERIADLVLRSVQGVWLVGGTVDGSLRDRAWFLRPFSGSVPSFFRINRPTCIHPKSYVPLVFITCFSLFLGPTVSFFAFSPHSSEFPAMDIGEDSVNPGWGSSHTSTFSCSNHRFLCPSSRSLPIAGFCFRYTEPQAFSVEKRSSLKDFCSIV